MHSWQDLLTLMLCLYMYTVQSNFLSKGSLKIISCSNRNTCRLHGLRVSGSATINVSWKGIKIAWGKGRNGNTVQYRFLFRIPKGNEHCFEKSRVKMKCLTKKHKRLLVRVIGSFDKLRFRGILLYEFKSFWKSSGELRRRSIHELV